MPNFQSFILQQVSRVFLSSEKYEELQKEIQRKSKAKAVLREANTHFEAKEYSAAISCAKSALKEMRYGKREKGSGAVTSFTAKDFDSRIVPALYLLAQSNLELRQFNHALFYCDQILAIRPHHHKTKFLQSNANLESGSFTKALSFYNTTHKKRKIQKF